MLVFKDFFTFFKAGCSIVSAHLDLECGFVIVLLFVKALNGF
jgi:hypothetical protein